MGKNAKIALYLPGNGFHSDVPPARHHTANIQHLGLAQIGSSGVPVATSFQALDEVVYPWLEEELARWPTVEVIRSTESHALTPFLHTRRQRQEVTSSLARGADHPVMFYPEFYIPEAPFLGSKAFLVLGAHTETYSYCYSPSCDSDGATRWNLLEGGQDLSDVAAISYGGSIGLVMKGFDLILRTFYAFQRDPFGKTTDGRTTLEVAIDAIEETLRMTPDDEVVIVPIDIEAPYVGSMYGEQVWGWYLGAIRESGLVEHFITLREAYERLRGKAQKSSRPHRELTQKWVGYEAQWKHSSRFLQWDTQVVPWQLIALASTSDALSGLYRQIVAHGQKRLRITAVREGEPHAIEILGNNGIVEVASAARVAIEQGRSFASALGCFERVPETLIVTCVREWATGQGV
jgi:hypothetical protein